MKKYFQIILILCSFVFISFPTFGQPTSQPTTKSANVAYLMYLCKLEVKVCSNNSCKFYVHYIGNKLRKKVYKFQYKNMNFIGINSKNLNKNIKQRLTSIFNKYKKDNTKRVFLKKNPRCRFRVHYMDIKLKYIGYRKGYFIYRIVK